MIYLASPYSHPDPLIRKNRLLLATQAAGILLKKDLPVFSPIVYGAAFPGDLFGYKAENWWLFNRTMLRKSSMLYLLCIPGVVDSVGVKQEVLFAKTIGLPIFPIDQYGEATEPPEVSWLR